MSEPLKSNTKRDLVDIAGDIHALERRSIFDIGKLLIEAHEACEHGEWGDWLDNEFEWSDDSRELHGGFPPRGQIPNRSEFEGAPAGHL
jgi:hypothetical protein